MWRVSKVYVKINRVIYKWNLFWKYIKTTLNNKKGNFYFCGVQSRIHFTAHPHTHTHKMHSHTPTQMHYTDTDTHNIYYILCSSRKKKQTIVENVKTRLHLFVVHTHTHKQHTQATHTHKQSPHLLYMNMML